MLVLSRSCIAFPVQLIPNKYGLFQSIGLDSCAGLVALAAAYIGRVSMLTNRAAALRGHRDDKALPPVDGNRPNATTAVVTSGEDGQPDPLLPLSPYPWKIPVKSRPKALIVLALLILAYFSSGYGAVVFEWSLYGLSALGVPISIAMHRSLQVLLGHLLWVGTGCLILGIGLRPFFPPRGSWYRLQWRRSWLWWVVGGYYVSSLLFNGADVINQLVLPPSVFQEGGESVVTKMINPENNDILALAVGSIAPCVSAPWWEEVLYRGFTLPALSVFMPPWVALPVSAVLFAVHHMSIQSMIPLATLGLAWGILYMLSNNLLVTVLIHAMWNSRVFLGSFLGL
ncbi:unnamed protein product [Vitrella brassicaformis CCMP3155]|uniref:CAAX prenyl protease 2/Lysostaphin resistance protein A-like domain-containing protein n=1 Tax=Vitrella brassicaformis (strain CCMP3155) TaxID=1169540 RepID=A0A0G4G260_VITBC|nr:unnamed protein product [Vitrella brassicaformis CCMP3155]|eukprot:CEM21913.1 unnamed protein product [Vitrella brassicaformis CCMP3155]